MPVALVGDEQLEHFVECINTGQTPISSAEDGVAIVRVLEWAQRDLRRPEPAETKPA